MRNQKKCFIYLSDKDYDGTVFNTQVANWLSLYSQHGVDFEYIHIFRFQFLSNRKYIKEQIRNIKSVGVNLAGWSTKFPSKGLLPKINSILWYFKLKKYFKKFDEIVLFSRCLYGKEIRQLKKLCPIPIKFIYDGRAASAEENRYSLIKANDFSKYRFDILSHVLHVEAETLKEADMIFTVSNHLRMYFIKNYNIPKQKFFLYPCLSDPNSFFYDEKVRNEIREFLGYNSNDLVILYSGGAGKYHLTTSLLSFFRNLRSRNHRARLLILSKDSDIIESELKEFTDIESDIKYFSVNNDEINKYLNAADYGVLIRENMPINNVASPSKFAEYMLAGLPCIISEGVGDYSDFCAVHNLGYIIKETELLNPKDFDYSVFDSYLYDRKDLAVNARKYFSKLAILPDVINIFNQI